MKRVYGWRPDRPDHRDFLFKDVQVQNIDVPSFIDLRSQCSKVENQETLGSCTANALAGNLEFLDIKEGKPVEDMSRLFIYYNERRVEGTVSIDSGAALRDGIKVLAQNGCCSEQDWPYNIKKFTNRPSVSCYIKALKHRISSYYSMTTQNDLLSCLASGYPFVFGISVYESFESQMVKQTGQVPMPGTNEKNLGGHAICAVGYDLNKKIFIVRNSWGESWGDKGYFYLPFEYVDKLASDFWTIRK